MQLRATAVLAALGLMIGCAGGERESETAAAEAAPQEPMEQEMAAPAAGGETDQALASQGETLFQAKACVGCHTIGGGRLSGPDLQGVADRREMEWIVAMISNPDSMLREDATARELLAEYATPMANMNVSREEARAIYAYLKQEGS